MNKKNSSATKLWPSVGCMLLFGPTVFAQTPPSSPVQSAAQTAIEQEQRARQQQEARERAQAIEAPGVRAPAAVPVEFPALPTETPCFRIDRFVLEVPADLPAAAQAQGASALPQDPFAFARAWLDHYQGACIGKQGVDLLVKGVSQAILGGNGTQYNLLEHPVQQAPLRGGGSQPQTPFQAPGKPADNGEAALTGTPDQSGANTTEPFKQPVKDLVDSVVGAIGNPISIPAQIVQGLNAIFSSDDCSNARRKRLIRETPALGQLILVAGSSVSMVPTGSRLLISTTIITTGKARHTFTTGIEPPMVRRCEVLDCRCRQFRSDRRVYE